jgi:hypothetical protein
MANSARYSINFAPLALAGDTRVRVGRQPYDQDRLVALRREFRETHVFRRSGDVITDVPVTAGQQPLGNVQEEIDLAQNEKLWPVLLSASLVRTFGGVRDLLPERSVSVLGAATGGLLQHPRLPAWVQRRTLVRFETRTIYSGERRTIGLICEVGLKNLLLATCAEAIAAGISPLGRYVQVEEPPPIRVFSRAAVSWAGSPQSTATTSSSTICARLRAPGRSRPTSAPRSRASPDGRSKTSIMSRT